MKINLKKSILFALFDIVALGVPPYTGQKSGRWEST